MSYFEGKKRREEREKGKKVQVGGLEGHMRGVYVIALHICLSSELRSRLYLFLVCLRISSFLFKDNWLCLWLCLRENRVSRIKLFRDGANV